MPTLPLSRYPTLNPHSRFCGNKKRLVPQAAALFHVSGRRLYLMSVSAIITYTLRQRYATHKITCFFKNMMKSLK